MLKESDKEWLRANYPGLVWHGEAVTGAIAFRASYRRETNQFVILGDDAPDDTGVVLAGSFNIQIEERRDKSTSRLPAVLVEEVEPKPGRHFNQRDKSACLCSPLEEDEFLEPEFSFQPFLERLVIPFLYGQAFYSSRGLWPWAEYEHGATGILEAYSKITGSESADACLQLLVQDPSWSQIKAALEQRPYVKGHTLCFCERGDQIRRCHPVALRGLLQLQRDLKAAKILIP